LTLRKIARFQIENCVVPSGVSGWTLILWHLQIF
jgi:hypothetical protein